MSKRKFPSLKPADALIRGKTAPKIVVVGPSSSGKSTLVYLLVNNKIIGYLFIGIGDKSQTTIIPCEFIFDERIEKEQHFSIKVRKKVFAKKDIHIVILEALSKLFNANSCDADETIDAMDDEWIESIIEPASASYHLKKMYEVIDFDSLREALYQILSEINPDEFNDRVRNKRKELQGQKIKISDIRYMIFEQIWDELGDDVKSAYYDWLSVLEKKIIDEIKFIVGEDAYDKGEVLTLSTEEDDVYEYGAEILEALFDPYTPFGLVIDEILLASRPRTEMMNLSEITSQGQPLRFCLRDTMGITQISAEPAEIRNALDSALNCKPDSILFLLSLEERDDVLKECCDALAEKLDRSNRLDVPVYIMFTKPDKILENKINKRNTNGIELSQNEYNKYIMDAIASMETSIKRYSENLHTYNVTWTSLRFRTQEIDPIQMSLKDEKVVNNFRPGGLFTKMYAVVNDTQKSILPKGMSKPLFVSVQNANEEALSIKVDAASIQEIIQQLKYKLTEDKEIVNGYIISDRTPRLSGRSVSTYWRRLQVGLGHKTRAYVYGNFSINMKAMLMKVLHSVIPDFRILYDAGAISTMANNLSEDELTNLVKALDEEGSIREKALAEVNPALINGWDEHTKNVQTLHLIFRDYFFDFKRYISVIDKIAFQLSYGNPTVRRTLEEIYYSPSSYDSNMRQMQDVFRYWIFDKKFESIFIREMEHAMTDMINKMFITI